MFFGLEGINQRQCSTVILLCSTTKIMTDANYALLLMVCIHKLTGYGNSRVSKYKSPPTKLAMTVANLIFRAKLRLYSMPSLRKAP